MKAECFRNPNIVDYTESSKYHALDPDKFNKGQLDKTPLESRKYTISLDWLELFGEAQNVEINEKLTLISDSIGLKHRGHGTAMYNDLIEVYYFGEKAAVLQVNPRFIKGAMKEKSAQIKFENHLLYSDYFIEFYEDLKAVIQFKLNNFTRIDIAIDNCKEVQEFLNFYNNQSRHDIQFLHKGKARFSALGLDKKTMDYQQFIVGTAKSEKQLSVYNKSKELEQSNKQYIREFWKNNGIKDCSEVFRVEMRLKSKFLKSVKDLTLKNLTDSTFLASLFKTATNNFFEFVENTDSNISRSKGVDLIPYDQLGGQLLEREKQPERDDIYKAKLTIHYLVKMLICNKVKPEEQDTYWKVIVDTSERFGLDDWYNEKIYYWSEQYSELIFATS